MFASAFHIVRCTYLNGNQQAKRGNVNTTNTSVTNYLPTEGEPSSYCTSVKQYILSSYYKLHSIETFLNVLFADTKMQWKMRNTLHQEH
jgi:hypothetical protein